MKTQWGGGEGVVVMGMEGDERMDWTGGVRKQEN